MAVLLADWELFTLLAALLVAVLGGVLIGSALRSAHRAMRELETYASGLVDPCADAVTVRLRCLDRRLAEIGRGLRSGPPVRPRRSGRRHRAYR